MASRSPFLVLSLCLSLPLSLSLSLFLSLSLSTRYLSLSTPKAAKSKLYSLDQTVPATVYDITPTKNENNNNRQKWCEKAFSLHIIYTYVKQKMMDGGAI